jgi:deoxyadenosine/deoxycytidine kinase
LEKNKLVKTIYRNKGSKDNIIISIAGAHGVGKTTVFEHLKRKFADNPKFKFFAERYVKRPPFPFGSPDKQIGFRSEIHFLQQMIKRNQKILNFDNRYNGRIIILDRTPLCVLIYSKSLNLKEKDYVLILEMYKSVEWKEDFIIYLTAKPETILKRIIQRGSLEAYRKEWNEHQKDYLLNILSYYNHFLFQNNENKNIFVIDTDKLNFQDLILEIQEIITQLSGYSFKKSIKSPSTQMSLIKFLK